MDLVLPGIGLIFWMSVTFIIVLFILKKYAWGPILTSLKERENEISSSLELAKQTQEDMKRLQADNEKLLKQAREERDVILREANKLKDSIIGEAKDKAQSEADRIVESARVNIESEKVAAIAELKNQVASLTIEVAEKVLDAELADKAKQTSFAEKQLETMNFN